MPVFTYTATDEARIDLSGSIAADTPRQARDLLRDRGLLVRDLSDYHKTPSAPRSFDRLRSLLARRENPRVVTQFVRELSTLLAVGVPLTEALETIARQYRGRFHASVLLLRDRVAGGASLAAAMREQPAAFDELCLNITEVGEDAGTLDASLERLADFRDRWEQLKGRVVTTLIYPSIVFAMALIAGTFLMTFVVPRILEPLVEQGQPLPFPTRVVKGASDFILAWWWALAGGAALLVTSAVALLRTPRARFAWHRAVLRIPLLGDLVRKQAIVRVAVVLGTLLKSGVVFVRALQIAQRGTANLALRDALVRCERAVLAGGDIADALEASSDAFPPLVVRVFSVGQQTGRLEEMLDRLAAAYDRQVNASAQRLAAVLEPALIVVLAALVLFIILATVLPILEAGNAIA